MTPDRKVQNALPGGAMADVDLSPADAAHYKAAFAAAFIGDWVSEETERGQLIDQRLEGTLLAARYLRPAAPKPSYAELAEWLQRYADLPDASDVYRLALRRRPASAPLPARPRSGTGFVGTELPGCHLAGIATLTRLRLVGSYNNTDAKRISHLETTVLAHLKDDSAVTARKTFEGSEVTSLLDPADRAALGARVAAGLLFDGDDDAAHAVAEQSVAEDTTEETLWIAGLTAYRVEDYATAETRFSAMESTGAVPAWAESAAAYWAGRSARHLHDTAEAQAQFRHAASFKATFYGMLAERALGARPSLRLGLPDQTRAEKAVLASIPAGARALALAQIGQTDLAEAELRQIEASGNPALKEALLSFASDAHLAETSQRLGIGLTGTGGRQYDAGPYPVPRWQPHGGFTVDPALVYAVMRQESRFDPTARSDAGAIGLMQLMPQTAAQLSSRTENWDDALRDPVTNVDLGQRYLGTLLNTSAMSGNLILVMAAYNGGMGNLARWRNGDQEDDPLMFIETIPAGETRAFVEQVMTNYWVYRLHMGQDTQSLTDLAADRWPVYAKPVPATTLVADLR